MSRKVTLEDFEIRYRNIRKANPKVKKCAVRGCPNPRDSTPSLGEDTICAYHRLLWDYWRRSVEVCKDVLKMSQKGRRYAFTNWMNTLGKSECDKLVLKMAQERGIWWEKKNKSILILLFLILVLIGVGLSALGYFWFALLIVMCIVSLVVGSARR